MFNIATFVTILFSPSAGLEVNEVPSPMIMLWGRSRKHFLCLNLQISVASLTDCVKKSSVNTKKDMLPGLSLATLQKCTECPLVSSWRIQGFSLNSC